MAVDRHTARLCLWVNLLALPGLGSVLAGRRVGWAQAVLAVAGLGLAGYGVVRAAADWLAAGEALPLWSGALELALVGLGLSAGAWGWALVTSLQVLRDSRLRRPQDEEQADRLPPRL